MKLSKSKKFAESVRRRSNGGFANSGIVDLSGLAALRALLKERAPSRAFALLSRQRALFLPSVGAKLSSSPSLIPPKNTVDLSGLEPLTSCLQSRRSTS